MLAKMCWWRQSEREKYSIYALLCAWNPQRLQMCNFVTCKCLRFFAPNSFIPLHLDKMMWCSMCMGERESIHPHGNTNITCYTHGWNTFVFPAAQRCNLCYFIDVEAQENGSHSSHAWHINPIDLLQRAECLYLPYFVWDFRFAYSWP